MGNPPVGIPPGSIGTPPFLPSQGTDPAIAYLQHQMAQQANTTGLTQVAPNVQSPQVPQPQPFQRQPTNNAPQPVGPGQRGAVTRAAMQNFTAGITNAVGTMIEKHQAREARDKQQTFDRFSQAYSGLNAAKAQADQAQQIIQQASAKLRENPQDQDAIQQIQQAKQQLQQAQQGMKQNQMILEDISSDPKKRKLIAKGFGIDDKNAGTPERQQAIAALRKTTGVGPNTAGLVAQMPQTQQLSPQAQAQQLARQSGVVGAPATQGQLLKAQTEYAKMGEQLQINKDNRERMFMRDLPKMEAQGLSFAKDADGNIQFDDRGFPKPTVMTKEEVAANPVQAAKQESLQAAIDFKKAQEQAMTDPNSPRNKALLMNAQANMLKAQTQAKLVSDGNIGGMAMLMAQKKMSPSQVPAKMRGVVIEQALKLDPKLDPEKLDTDLATKKATERDFAVGKAATNVRSLNTGIGHLDQLMQASDALKNNDLTTLNRLAGGLKRAGLSTEQGTDALAVFNTIESAVVGEVASTYKGTGATDKEIEDVKRSFSDAKASRTTDKVALETINLFYSRLNALDHQHKVGTQQETFDTLSPEATSILKSRGFDTETRESRPVSDIIGGGASLSDDELLKQLDANP